MKTPDVQQDVITPHRGVAITCQTICRPDLSNQKAYSMSLCVMVASDTDENRYCPAESVDLNLDAKATDQLIEVLKKHRERLQSPQAAAA